MNNVQRAKFNQYFYKMKWVCWNSFAKTINSSISVHLSSSYIDAILFVWKLDLRKTFSVKFELSTTICIVIDLLQDEVNRVVIVLKDPSGGSFSNLKFVWEKYLFCEVTVLFKYSLRLKVIVKITHWSQIQKYICFNPETDFAIFTHPKIDWPLYAFVFKYT